MRLKERFQGRGPKGATSQQRSLAHHGETDVDQSWSNGPEVPGPPCGILRWQKEHLLIIRKCLDHSSKRAEPLPPILISTQLLPPCSHQKTHRVVIATEDCARVQTGVSASPSTSVEGEGRGQGESVAHSCVLALSASGLFWSLSRASSPAPFPYLSEHHSLQSLPPFSLSCCGRKGDKLLHLCILSRPTDWPEEQRFSDGSQLSRLP